MSVSTLHSLSDPLALAFARVGVWRRRALGVDSDLEADFAEWFGLRSGQARLLARLHAAQGAAVDVRKLAPVCRLGEATVHQYVKVLREALGAGSVVRAGSRAYRLTPPGLEECGRAAREMARERAGLGEARLEAA